MNMKRILIKLSGEALKGNSSTSFSHDVLRDISVKVGALVSKGIQVGIVVGGGNIFRGKESMPSLDRCSADHMGMLATIINGIAIQNILRERKIKSQIFSAFSVEGLCELFNHKKALDSFEEGSVVVCVGGSGNPYFTTDTAAVLRALELECDLLLKATQVDGVYNDDPRHNKQAKRFEKLSYEEVIQQNLKVMDATAVALAAEHKLPIMVFSLQEDNCFEKVLNNQLTHTIIS